jgi:hypothetical protein
MVQSQTRLSPLLSRVVSSLEKQLEGMSAARRKYSILNTHPFLIPEEAVVLGQLQNHANLKFNSAGDFAA